jgi:hypothetical protein
MPTADNKKYNVDTPEEPEGFLLISDATLVEFSRVVTATLTTEQLYHLVNLFLGVAFERERIKGVSPNA